MTADARVSTARQSADAVASTRGGQPAPSHEDWVSAREQRDRLALRAVRHLLDGNVESATACARLSDAAGDSADRIASALDADPGAYA